MGETLPSQPQNESQAATSFLVGELILYMLKRSTSGPAPRGQGHVTEWEIDQLLGLKPFADDLTHSVEDAFIRGEIPGDIGRIGGQFDPYLAAAANNRVALRSFPDGTYVHFDRTAQGEMVVTGFKPSKTGKPVHQHLWPPIEDVDTQPLPSVSVQDTEILSTVSSDSHLHGLLKTVLGLLRGQGPNAT